MSDMETWQVEHDQLILPQSQYQVGQTIIYKQEQTYKQGQITQVKNVFLAHVGSSDDWYDYRVQERHCWSAPSS